ncbi:hypothetical protein R1sor_023370 [Riccia sorocarpa]|uniref:FCP1 homology domain-containing protein n=1 Tax=Riccia sorocarpa TaxID=122646 RepID=A0ABD3GPP7_9MARC
MGIVKDLTVSKEFTIVSVMDYGQQLVDFTSAIKEMKDAKVIFEVGCYENERPVRQTNLAKPTWQLVYAFVSLGPEEYKPKLVENFDYRPHSCELRYKTWKEVFTLDKGVGSEAVNFKNKAPRWDFVGIEPAEGSKPYVHPGSKRRFFCTRLLNNFSSEGTTVLDFFSGGVFAREALLSSRDVIYFASSQLEAEFMAKFGKLLQTHSNRVRDWFETYKKKHAGYVEVEAPPQAEQSGAVTIAAITTPFVPDGNVMASAIERLVSVSYECTNFNPSSGRVPMTCLGYFFSLAKCPQIFYQARVEEDESNPQGETSNPQVFEGGGSGLVPKIDWGASTTHIEQGASTSQNEQGASTAQNEQGASTSQNEQGASTSQNEQGASTSQNEQGASTAQEPRIIGTPQSGEEFPLANIFSQARSVEAADVAFPVQPSDKNDNSEPIELPIAGVPVTADNAADEVPLAVDEGRPEDNATAATEEANAQIPGNTSGALAPTDKSLWPALDFMQMDNTLVKHVDLLPMKLLILDVEGLLLYAKGFMDKTSRTDCGDVISNGMKAVRRNGVQALMSRCLELFDVALWSCCSRNTLWDYTHYLFSGEQYNKFLFMWDYNKALDTKEKWTHLVAFEASEGCMGALSRFQC